MPRHETDRLLELTVDEYLHAKNKLEIDPIIKAQINTQDSDILIAGLIKVHEQKTAKQEISPQNITEIVGNLERDFHPKHAAENTTKASTKNKGFLRNLFNR